MNVYIRKNTSYYHPIIYVLKIIEKNRNVIFNIKNSAAEAEIIWDHKNIKSEVLAYDFFDSIKNGSASLKHSEVFLTSPNVTDKNDNVEKMKAALEIKCLSEEIKDRFCKKLVKLGHYEII